MLCPYCKYKESKVIDSRETEGAIRRRRECLQCGKRFTTYERVEKTDLVVIKKDGRREAFNPEKLKRGILKACEKRPISTEKIDKLCEELETKLKKRAKIEIPSALIGEMVMKKLKKVDEIAYVRFASVYKEFKDVGEFKKELRDLK
ncbi:transcriptional regulator NrdR [Candidatus Pacearchaeota archaeon ex4484_26]|nr:MAG: transcriptional regulator NrdR [Candidatus Pacearchaeota archaeon ex4484_26]